MITVDEFAQEAKQWLAENRHLAPRDYGAICPPDMVNEGLAWQKHLYASGKAGIHWPVEFGGQGLTAAHQAQWLYECALVGVPGVFNMVGLVLTGGSVQKFGTPEQQAKHLNATLQAEHVWCQLFSEPGAGSDLGSLSTKAERDGDRYIVNGQKVWCSGGRYSNWGILMARTNADAPKHEGISFFLLDMSLPGIEIRPLKQMTGEAEFDEVFFTDVEMPAEALLGPLHGGWGVGMAVLTSERGHIGTSVISLERRLDSISRLAEGRDLSPTERQEITTLLSKGMAYKAMAQLQGPVASTAASLMKLGITEMMFETSMLRSNISGMDSLLEGPEAFGVLSAPGGRIAGGTSQVQRNIIGERLLGLPREPSVKKPENN
ncbi:MAG: acyl-CoA dehydrogenase family protein [Ilumatobacteraceae bacterium]|jgi:alkylation response protein AidB-like acyl-CoA dehydrogenase|nr:acyl-CoA dehydrogenase family protein [Ilumatobacteraceae bacterium]MDP4705199.1 acyl-CoA dehydrogenase family protein [Ilumatobacteraceae bacterium]MDP4713613.1 acyl-CoA dehydrogenase family protein [Ilumatobacteraceae bacterium]MDP4936053.1 acyl-CoA dehydrogenase family protein [Ilumatobacteraceae bacterium]MDP4976423.1 acyl-CoA dehydrogenase family protein [Ilumatobacteraceae bacterium]